MDNEFKPYRIRWPNGEVFHARARDKEGVIRGFSSDSSPGMPKEAEIIVEEITDAEYEAEKPKPYPWEQTIREQARKFCTELGITDAPCMQPDDNIPMPKEF